MDMYTLDDVEGITNIIFESFAEYLAYLENEKIVISKSQADGLGFPIRDDEKPVAFRKFETGYLGLYDRSEGMEFIAKRDIQTGKHGFDEHLERLGIEPNKEDIISYRIVSGVLCPVYDLESILERLQLKRIKKPKFPLVKKEYIPADLTEHDDKIAGCHITRETLGVYYDFEKIAAAEGKTIIKDLVVEDNRYKPLTLPLCNKWFFNEFKNKIDCFDTEFEGYYLVEEGVQKAYDIRKICKEIYLIKKGANPYDKEIAMTFDEYENYRKTLPDNYGKLYTEFVGITSDDKIIIKGTNSPKWANIVERYMGVSTLPIKQNQVSVKEINVITDKQKKYIGSLLDKKNKILTKNINELTFEEAGYIIGNLTKNRKMPEIMNGILKTDYKLEEDNESYILDDYSFEERD